MKEKQRNLKRYHNLLFSFLLLLVFITIIASSIFMDYKSSTFIMEYYNLLYDKSINEETHTTIEETVKTDNQLYLQNKKYNSVFVPKDSSSLATSFTPFFDNGTKAIFASGFLFEQAIKENLSNLNNFIIYVDDGAKTFVNNPNKYITSISIPEITSGFLAGILGSIYLTTVYDNPKDWKAGLWGGFPFFSIVLFMSGYQYGMEFFKYEFQEIIPNVDQLELLSPFPNKTTPEQKWYTNSFNLDGSGTTATINLLNQGAKVIYPIAGFQTKEALNYISENNLDAKVIGVDSDASIKFPENEKEILFSTTKDFKKPLIEDINAFYTSSSNDEISKKLKENEVFSSEITFNHNDSKSFDNYLKAFGKKYSLEIFDKININEVINYLQKTTLYKTLLKYSNFADSATFSSEGNVTLFK